MEALRLSFRHFVACFFRNRDQVHLHVRASVRFVPESLVVSASASVWCVGHSQGCVVHTDRVRTMRRFMAIYTGISTSISASVVVSPLYWRPCSLFNLDCVLLGSKCVGAQVRGDHGEFLRDRDRIDRHRGARQHHLPTCVIPRYRCFAMRSKFGVMPRKWVKSPCRELVSQSS